MSETLFHRRLFLNDKTGAAMLEACLDDNSWTNNQTGERRNNLSGNLHITDCSRSIELNFDAGDVEEARDCLRKMDRLIDSVQDMRDAFARSARRMWPGKKF